MSAALNSYSEISVPSMSVAELVKRANELHEIANTKVILSKEAGILAGIYVNELQTRKPHCYPKGQWQKWAIENLAFPKSTRELYQRAADHPELARKAKNWKTFGQTLHDLTKAQHRLNRKLAIINAPTLKHEENWQVHHCDARTFDWPKALVIWTDPLWPMKANDYRELELYEWLADMAKEKLLPGGLLAVQCCQSSLAKIFPIFKDFDYYSELVIDFPQGTNKILNSLLASHTPILLFGKGWTAPKNIDGKMDVVRDCITDREHQKELHEFQQPLNPMCRWIRALTPPGCLVLDPFAGSATNGVAVKKVGEQRRYLATERDAGMVKVARKRLRDTTEGSWADEL